MNLNDIHIQVVRGSVENNSPISKTFYIYTGVFCPILLLLS